MRSVLHRLPAIGLAARNRRLSVARILSMWLMRHRSRQGLARLEPYLLRDIGVTPEEAHRELTKPFWRK
jgi:uncharacterized protein YjiS (DUF1127 family)